MNDLFAETGLKFFGAMNASISHEIKNRMAVMNEQAGLLKDLVHQAENGREMNLERLKRLAESLKTQVTLTDGIIRNMNRFAHSVDNFQCPSDLCEVLSLMAALSKRTADNKGVRIELRLPEPSVSIDTAPFLLMNLIWLCLEALMPFADLVNPVTMGCEKVAYGAIVWLSAGLWPEKVAPVIPDAAFQVANALQAEVDLNQGEKMLKFGLPAKHTKRSEG